MIPLTHLLVLPAVYTSLLFVVLCSIWLSKATSVYPSKRNLSVVAVRLAFVIASAYYVLCYVGGLQLKWLVVVSVIFLILSFPASLKGNSILAHIPAGSDPISFAILFAIFAPVYFIKQYILGFPERDVFVLQAPVLSLPERRKVMSVVSELTGQSATVIATLKPIGKIECEGKQFEAISFDGSLIEVGKRVQIGEIQNRLYVVHPLSMPA